MASKQFCQFKQEYDIRWCTNYDHWLNRLADETKFAFSSKKKVDDKKKEAGKTVFVPFFLVMSVLRSVRWLYPLSSSIQKLIHLSSMENTLNIDWWSVMQCLEMEVLISLLEFPFEHPERRLMWQTFVTTFLISCCWSD